MGWRRIRDENIGFAAEGEALETHPESHFLGLQSVGLG